MTIDEFVKKYKNGVDYDGSYGKQCVDYVNQYAKDVLGIPDAFYGQGIQYAYQVYTLYNNLVYVKKNFIRIANERTNYPKKGDVIVWSKERNGYAGHIAVVLGADEHTIKVAEQNYDGKGGVRVYTYPNYNYVLGWLRARNSKVNRPNLKKGDKFKLKKQAKLYAYDTSKGGLRKLSDFSNFAGEAVLKVGAYLTADEIKTKGNGNVWVFLKKYGGWICVYDYKNDISKV